MGDEGTRRAARLWRVEAGGVSVLALAPVDEAPLSVPHDASAWFRGPLVVDQLDLPEAQGRVFRLGKRLGTRARLLQELARLQAAAPAAPLLHLGGLAALRGDERDRCVRDLRASGAAVISVDTATLALAPDEVEALQLPFVAANVTRADGARPFPRHVVLDVQGRRVAVISAAHPGALDELPPAQRARWRVEDPRAGVEAALVEVAEASPPVDAIVGLGPAAALLDDGQSGARRGFDVIVGAPVLAELGAREERVGVDSATRALAVPPPPVLIARPSSVGPARLTLSFDDDGVAEVAFATYPVGQEGARIAFDGVPLDPLFARLGPGGSLLLPDLDPLLRQDPALAALAFGEQVLHRGGRHRFSLSQPARVTDPVWMRLVTNAMREETGAEVALARNLTRTFDVTGPLSRSAVLGWLPEDEIVDVVDITGRDLLALVAAIRAAADDPRTPPHDLVFAAGLDLRKGVVEGRPIDVDAPYKVAVTRSAAAVPELAQLLGPPPLEAGEPLRALVLRRLLAEVPDPRAPGALAAVKALLEDRSQTVRGHWQFRVDDLSASGTLIQSAPGIERFARSRETRATTPNLLNLGLRGDAAVLYNGRLLGWENRLQLRYSNLIVLIDGVPPREQEDEILATSEVRLQQLAHGLVGRFFTLRPYAQLAFDSEFTATPDVTRPGQSLPHQLLVRQALGFAALPASGWVQELRLGVVVQEDGSELTTGPVELADLHLDVGFTAGVSLFIPLGAFAYRSFTEGRLYVPDPDDRPEDLGLRLSSHHRLEGQLFGAFHGFLFADALVLTSKRYDSLPSGSLLVGAGFQFRTFFKL